MLTNPYANAVSTREAASTGCTDDRFGNVHHGFGGLRLRVRGRRHAWRSAREQQRRGSRRRQGKRAVRGGERVQPQRRIGAGLSDSIREHPSQIKRGLGRHGDE